MTARPCPGRSPSCGSRSPGRTRWCSARRSTRARCRAASRNLLDWTVGGGQLYGKPVAWVNVAAEGRGEGAQATLTMVLGYVGAEPAEAACRRLPVARGWVGPDGTVSDPGFRAAMTDVAAALAAAVSPR